MNFSRLVPNPPQRSAQNQLPPKLPNWSLRASMAPLAEDGKNHSLGVLDSWMGLNCGVKGKEVKGSVKWTLFFVQPSYDIAKETLMSRFFCKFHCASSGKKNSFESLQWLGRKNKIISPKYVKALKCQQTTRLNLGLTAASKTHPRESQGTRGAGLICPSRAAKARSSCWAARKASLRHRLQSWQAHGLTISSGSQLTISQWLHESGIMLDYVVTLHMFNIQLKKGHIQQKNHLWVPIFIQFQV
jgi:hypothetical protein